MLRLSAYAHKCRNTHIGTVNEWSELNKESTNAKSVKFKKIV